MKYVFMLVCGALLWLGCAETSKVDPMMVDGPDYSQTTEKTDQPLRFGPMRGIAEVLELSDSQREEIQAVMAEYREETKAARRTDKSARKGDFRERRQEHADAIWEKVSPLLTDEQRSIAEQIRADREAGVVSKIMIEHRVSKMDEALNLSSEQEKQLAAILTEEATERIAQRDDESLNRREKRRAFREHREAYRDKIIFILDSEQQETFNELAEQRKAEFRQRFAKRKAGKKRGGPEARAERQEQRLNHMEEALGLTAEQRTQLEAIFEEARPQMEQLRESDQTREERRSAVQAHRQVVSQKIEGMLTEEQKVKFQELKAEQEERRANGRQYGRKQREMK